MRAAPRSSMFAPTRPRAPRANPTVRSLYSVTPQPNPWLQRSKQEIAADKVRLGPRELRSQLSKERQQLFKLEQERNELRQQIQSAVKPLLKRHQSGYQALPNAETTTKLNSINSRLPNLEATIFQLRARKHEAEKDPELAATPIARIVEFSAQQWVLFKVNLGIKQANTDIDTPPPEIIHRP